MKKIIKICIYAVLLAFAVIELYPFVWVILSSFKNNFELINSPFGLPKVLRFTGYIEAVTKGGILIGAMNSILYTSGTVILQLVVSSAAAFILVKDSFKTLKFFYGLILFGLMVPAIAGLLPVYIFYRDLGIYGTYASIILVYTVRGIPFSVFFIATFMKGIPRSLEEAAIMDGANMLWIYAKVIVPLSKPVLATVATFIALQVWNDMITPSIFADTMSMQPITIAILKARTMFSVRYGTMFSAITLVAVPFFIIFALFQNQVISGVTVGAVKG